MLPWLQHCELQCRVCREIGTYRYSFVDGIEREKALIAVEPVICSLF